MIELNRWVETKARDSSSRLPLLNYFQSEISKYDLTDYQQVARKKRLMLLMLRTPELVGMLLDIGNDVIDDYEFEHVNEASNGSGRNRIKRAEDWVDSANFDETMLETFLDIICTGEGFAFLGTQVQKILDGLSNKPRMKAMALDEGWFNPPFRTAASTTMIVRHDNVNVTGYTQVVSGDQTQYDLASFMRFTFAKVNGRVEGYTPVYSIPLHLELLWLLWVNQLDLQQKGNMPDYFVIAESLKSNTVAFKELETKLKSYNYPGNSKHGITLLADSEYSIEKMERDTTLQFEDVGKAVTSVIASLFQYPKGRLNVKTKEAASDKDNKGESEKAYWKNVNKWQNRLARVLNSQLFVPFFGVRIKFNKQYLHDAVVENTAVSLRLNNTKLTNDMLASTYGKRIPVSQLLKIANNDDEVNLNVDDLEDVDPALTALHLDPKSTLNNQLPGSSLSKSMSGAERQNRKDVEMSRESTGKGTPSGV